MILDKLPDGHITVDQAIQILKKHTAKKPTVDLDFALDSLNYIQVAKNATLKLMKQDAEGKWYSFNHVAVVMPTAREYEMYKWEVKQTVKRVSGKMPEPEKEVVSVSSMVDDLEGSNPQPRKDRKNKSKFGDPIVSKETTNEALGDA